VTYLGYDGREHRDKFWRGEARIRYDTRRACDGWPELGSCSSFAIRGCDYCRECESLRRAHEGLADLNDEDCNEGREQ